MAITSTGVFRLRGGIVRCVCAISIVLGSTHVLAQAPAAQTATARDVRQPEDKRADVRIVVRNGKPFLITATAPPEGAQLDTSETPLPLKVLSDDGKVISRCAVIVNEGPGPVTLSLAPQPARAQQIFDPKTVFPMTIAPKDSARICPSAVPVDRVANVIVAVAGQLSDVLSFSSAEPRRELIIDMKVVRVNAQNPASGLYEAIVRLDGTGVADWRFLNPRRIHRVCVVAESTTQCAAALPAPAVDLVFENTLSDRVLVVTFTDIPRDQRGSFLQAGLNVTCDGSCTASVQIDRNARAHIAAAILQRAYAPTGTSARPVQFTVSKFIEDSPLANSRGYFTVVEHIYTTELPAKSGWSFTGQADAMRESDLTGLFAPCPKEEEDCSKDPSITTVRTLGGEHRTRVNGTARLGFNQTMGARADVDVEVQIKKGDLGGDETTAQVKATKYRLNINARNGWVVSGGRYTFAEPAQSIAISESGEGVSVKYRVFEMGHLLKRETGGERVRRLIRDATDDDPENDRKLEDGDHSTTMLQVREVITPGGHVRLNAIALYGRSEPQGIRSTYTTGGGDATYWIPKLNTAHTLSWYHSRRSSSTPLKDGTDKGSGTAWLFTSNVTNLHRSATDSDTPSTDFTLAFLVGRGSGDRADTAARREDYIGETAGFSPDLIFLNTLAEVFGIDPATEGRVGKGLSNKLYIGLTADTPRYSPLVLLAKLLRTGDDVAKGGSGMSLRWHWYRLNEPVLASHFAGQEVDVDFRVEAPAKVKYSVALGVYVPGAAIKPLVTKTQWKVQGNVSVKM